MSSRIAPGLRPLLVSAALLLGGCASGPVYERPQTSIPTNWTAGTADARWPALDWWTAFADPTLNKLVSAALQNNHDVGAAAERIAQARAQALIAGSQLYPAVSASAGLGRKNSSSDGREQLLREPSASYDLGLTASYQLDLFGEAKALADVAAAGVAASEFDRQSVALSVAAATVSAYLQLSAVDERRAVLNSTLDAARKTLELVRARQHEGRASGLEVAQQRAEVARLEATIPTLETEREQFRNVLSVLTGSAPGNFTVTAAPIDRLAVPATPAGLPSTLLEHRPDVLRAELALAGANANIRAATAASFPRIALTAEGGFASLALKQLFNPGKLLYSLAAAVTAPVFDAGRVKGQIALNEARYRELAENYQKAVLSAFTDVDNALTAQSSSALVVNASRARVVQASEANRIVELQLRGGMADYLAVLEAQRALLLAREAHVLARLDQLNASVSVYQALGGGWDRCMAAEQIDVEVDCRDQHDLPSNNH